MNRAAITVGQLLNDMLIFTAKHKSGRDYISKAEVLRKDLGARAAAEVTPQELELWLRKHCKTPATTNRYRAALSLACREGMRNGKVMTNPARLVAPRKEPVGRLRFLSRDEYNKLREVIARKYPGTNHVAEFIVGVHTGMRLTEQFSLRWNQVDLKRRQIDLTKTKNYSPRTVFLNASAVEALQSLQRRGQKPTDPVFPRQGRKGRFDTRSWFEPSVEEAAIPRIIWYEATRHTCGSWLAMAGASMKEIQVAMGHKTITVSARYSHLSPQHSLSVIDRIADGTESSNIHLYMHQQSESAKAQEADAKELTLQLAD
ncbi:MAG: site-specific integrase [Acidobacteriaceae bacterium]